ncbi:WbqC family protein [Paraburkholderia sediminicola]|uniref:WbqC family protein n=1 Tax=Paraburkholderia rhynchosiae TaxID=487049 RepID=A0ACC7N889_9BURK
MKLAIMQPYFLPYIGYFQLIHAVDCFVLYDNIKYTKKGWINRNRFLVNGTDSVFTIPLQNDSDSFDVAQRTIAPEFNKTKLLNRFREAYRRAPNFPGVWPALEQVVMNGETSLLRYIHDALLTVCSWIGIDTEIVLSSSIDIDHSLSGRDKVVAICQKLGAEQYLNAIGGRELYSRADFLSQGIELSFLQSEPIEYPQFDHPFVPWLSIVDVMMFNQSEQIRPLLSMWTPV